MSKKEFQGQILKDLNSKGKDRNWRGRKILSLKLANIFEILGYNAKMIDRVASCGSFLSFIRDSDGTLRLYQAFFCKNKLCPMCNWRRAMKYSYQTSRIVDVAMQREPKGRFLFLTLTVKNIPGDELKNTLTKMSEGFNRLFKYKRVQKNLLGYLRSVEVTYNEQEKNYHPHIHVLLFVRPNYFNGRGDNYISQVEWGELWAKSLKSDYVPMVDIRAVKPTGKGLKGAILETAKYPTKPMDLNLNHAHVVDDLYKGLHRKRQLGYGGIFKIIKKELAMDDVEDGDLVHTTESQDDLSNGTKIIAIWNVLRQNYFISE